MHAGNALPNAALDIANDIQTKTLIKHNELYDILLLNRSRRPNLQVTTAATQSEAASLVTPTEHLNCHLATSTEEAGVKSSIVTPTNDSSKQPTVMPTGVATENGFIDAPELVKMMQLALSLLKSGDQAGAE